MLEYERGVGSLRCTRRKGRLDEADDETTSGKSPPGSTTARGFPMVLTSSSVHRRSMLQWHHTKPT